jgi:hypothetical protein
MPLDSLNNVNFQVPKLGLISMRFVHHWLSLTGTFVALFFTFYLVLDYTVGLIPWVHRWTVGPVSGRSILFTIIVLAVIIRYVKIRSPYSK